MLRIHLHKLLMAALLVAAAGGDPAWSQGSRQSGDVPAELIHYPEMVFINGRVLIADDDFSVAEAIAIRDGKVLLSGESALVRRLAGPETLLYDLNGGTVVPGFIDTHQHLHDYATRELSVSLRWETVESGLEEVRVIARSTPPGEWIELSVRPYSARQVDRYRLDEVAPDNPLALVLSTEEMILNSRALERAEIPSDATGLIRNSEGELTGRIFSGQAAGRMVYEVLPWPDIERVEELIEKEIARENATGLTTIATRISPDALTAVRNLWAKKRLNMRWRAIHQFADLNPDIEAWLKRLGNFSGLGDSMFKIIGTSVISVDSAIGRGGAWTWKPKLRQHPGSLAGAYGVSRIEDRENSDFRAIVETVRYGWSHIGVHSAGDRANSELLEAYRLAKASPIVRVPDQRLGIDHGPMLTAEHIQSMRELGVIPSIAAKYLFDDPTNLVYLYGADAVDKMTPVRSVIDAGIRPVAEADTGGAPMFHPLWQMQKFITRTDESGRVWNKEQGISRQQALMMYTNWAARYTGDEEILGTLEPGKLADLVVLEGDFLEAPAEKLSQLKVLLTVLGGRVIYRDPAADLQTH